MKTIKLLFTFALTFWAFQQAGAQCTAGYYTYADTVYTGDTVFFGDNSTVANPGYTAYYWIFGDGTTMGYTANVKHIYKSSGTFWVCHSVYDSIANCRDTICFNIVIINRSGSTSHVCNASSSMAQIPYSKEASFTGSGSSSTSLPMSYKWYFGDGTTSTSAVTTHSYNYYGTYGVSFVMKTDSCSDSTYQTLDIDSMAYRLVGSVIYDSAAVDYAWVYLIRKDSNILTAIDTFYCTPSNPSFQFDGMAPGNYYVKAALDSIDTEYANYLPTYYGYSLTWSGASLVDPATSSYITINLIAGTNPGGPGFIGGNVLTGANKKEGDPIGGVEVFITDLMGNPVAFTHSKENGQWSIDNIAFGTYYLTVDVPGRTVDPMMITISDGKPKIENISVTVSSTEVVLSIAIGIDQIDVSNAIKLFPNPASSYVVVDMPQQVGTISVINTLGEILITKPINEQAKLDVSHLQNGVYLITFKSDGHYGSIPLIKF